EGHARADLPGGHHRPRGGAPGVPGCAPELDRRGVRARRHDRPQRQRPRAAQRRAGRGGQDRLAQALPGGCARGADELRVRRPDRGVRQLRGGRRHRVLPAGARELTRRRRRSPARPGPDVTQDGTRQRAAAPGAERAAARRAARSAHRGPRLRHRSRRLAGSAPRERLDQRPRHRRRARFDDGGAALGTPVPAPRTGASPAVAQHPRARLPQRHVDRARAAAHRPDAAECRRARGDALMAWIAGERVILRAWEREDVQARWEAEQSIDSELLQRLRDWYEPPRSLAQRESEYESEVSEPDATTISLVVVADGRAIGDVNLFQIETRNRNALIGIGIWRPQDCDRGYGTDAMRTMLRWAFGHLNLHRVELSVDAENARAIHVYEKLGFVREGMRREQHYDGGRYHDELIMGVLAHEFAARHGVASK